MKKITVYGQEKAKEILQSAFKTGRLAHAYLFLGPEGSGKDAAAISTALMVNCENRVFGGCGECRTCQAILSHEAPDFSFIHPEPKKNKSMKEEVYRDVIRERLLKKLSDPYSAVKFTPEITGSPLISVDQIRELKKGAHFKVAGDGMRVFVISHADQMNANASNSLLKLLEEPPPQTILILTSTQEGALLETVVSRCQVIRFSPLTEKEVTGALMSERGISEKDAKILAAMAEGSITRGLELLETEFTEKREAALEFLDISINGLFEKIGTTETGARMLKDREFVKEVFRFLIIWLRDVMFVKTGIAEKAANSDKMEKLKETAEKFSETAVENAVDHLYQTIDYIGKNVYLPLAVYKVSSDINLSIKQ